jgi:hypothetical protein
MNDMSGSPVFRKGVGTHILTASHWSRAEKSVVAASFPDFSSRAISLSETSWM